MRHTALFTIVALALTLGCSKSKGYEPKAVDEIPVVSVATGQESSLAPLAVGNQWVYTMEQGANKGEITMKVEDVQQVDGGTNATIGVYPSASQSNTVPSQKMDWRVDSSGIFQLTTGSDTVYDPPQLLVPFPLEEGVEHEISGSGGRPFGGPGAYTATIKVLGPQEVDTESDRMSAIAIQSTTQWETAEGPAASVTITWWRPDIGFVRQKQEIRTQNGTVVSLLKLKSHSFPRSSK